MGIRNIFTLWQFTKIGHYFCVSVKSLELPRDSDSYDKMYKIQPIVKHLNKVFPKYYHYGPHVVLDESTVAMHSRYSSRDFALRNLVNGVGKCFPYVTASTLRNLIY